MAVAVVLGSSFDRPELAGEALQAVPVSTPHGDVRLYRAPALKQGGREAYVVFRHGVPHRYLPPQIPYRAYADALRVVGVEALLVTSSVGVMDAGVPLYEPLLVGDLLMPENRLPDGSTCTMWPTPAPGQGHLVLDEGLFSRALGAQLDALHGRPLPRVVFAYVGGPRTKTRAENRWLAAAGAHVNSMTLGPEVVLANELGIPTAGLVVGHKYSLAAEASGVTASLTEAELAATLARAKLELERLAVEFLAEVRPPRFGNKLFRFG